MKLWSINAASAEIGKDRRFLSKVLDSVPPDGRLNRKHPGWHLRTILDAIARHERGDAGPDEGVLDEAERLSGAVQALIDRLAAEPDIEARRAMVEQGGTVFGALDNALARCQATLPPDEAAIYQPYLDRVQARTFNALMNLCEWRLEPKAA